MGIPYGDRNELGDEGVRALLQSLRDRSVTEGISSKMLELDREGESTDYLFPRLSLDLSDTGAVSEEVLAEVAEVAAMRPELVSVALWHGVFPASHPVVLRLRATLEKNSEEGKHSALQVNTPEYDRELFRISSVYRKEKKPPGEVAKQEREKDRRRVVKNVRKKNVALSSQCVVKALGRRQQLERGSLVASSPNAFALMGGEEAQEDRDIASSDPVFGSEPLIGPEQHHASLRKHTDVDEDEDEDEEVCLWDTW